MKAGGIDNADCSFVLWSKLRSGHVAIAVSIEGRRGMRGGRRTAADALAAQVHEASASSYFSLAQK
jgi:hypothetical protein